jgi:Arc/MetJ family transcription regulator
VSKLTIHEIWLNAFSTSRGATAGLQRVSDLDAAPDYNVYRRFSGYTSMRTNIVIDDRLMRDALRATGLKTKREAVELGLQTLVRLRKQAEIRRLRGKLEWRGDLDELRRDK